MNAQWVLFVYSMLEFAIQCIQLYIHTTCNVVSERYILLRYYRGGISIYKKYVICTLYNTFSGGNVITH